MGRIVRVNFSLDSGHSLNDFPVNLYSGLTIGDTTNIVRSNILSADVPFNIEFEDSDLNINTDPSIHRHPYCYLRISSEGCIDETILLEVPRVDCEMCASFEEYSLPVDCDMGIEVDEYSPLVDCDMGIEVEEIINP